MNLRRCYICGNPYPAATAGRICPRCAVKKPPTQTEPRSAPAAADGAGPVLPPL
jgi:NMD protein affecting ribosome stability and mRNA decay